MRRPLSLLAAALVVACSPQPGTGAAAATGAADAQTAESRHPVSGLEIIPLAVISDGERHEFAVEVARTAQEQARGLMFRTELGPNEGMIFPRNPPDVASFWMKNTPLPLDIIFVGEDGRIMNIAANTVPYSLESVSAVGLTSAVLEIPGGRAAELGIEPGDAVEW
ncbi:DUF192 domain-containing protein [Pelagerythrobacter rhizovicinus]|uniref:DUF192 domain-containing protein n=1 Tax=Pelagerythrobacter rhizovicinus TaxID=2268576 RepID=A0A4Q2KGL8_9SPHN|nr:DUF192 domain-containing protein [Pelagerythrobacter rhizovicinus]RXZ64205.1 DUF192 domain-containing protein [Pelagerythrobacter rhizovicinus]